jgi:hypothetical protein
MRLGIVSFADFARRVSASGVKVAKGDRSEIVSDIEVGE